MKLQSYLPTKFEVSGYIVKLKTAASFWMKFATIQEKTPDTSNFMTYAVKSVRKNGVECGFEDLTPEILTKIYEKVFYFQTCGVEPEKYPQAKKKQEKILDYNKDLPAIIAAFQQVYNINLLEIKEDKYLIDTMHWWHFSALLNNLPSGNQLKDFYMYYRSVDIKDMPNKTDYDKKQRAHIIKMKEIVSLNPKKQTQPEESEFLKRSRRLNG